MSAGRHPRGGVAVPPPPPGGLWTPADLGALLWGWFKPDPLSVSHTAGRVSEWRSMVGSNMVVQATASRQPLFTSGVTVNFDISANNQFMASPARAFSASGVRTVATVGQATNNSSIIGVDVDEGFVNGMCSAAEQSNGGRHLVQAFSVARFENSNTAVGTNVKHMRVGVANATQLISRVNGGTPATFAAPETPRVGATTSGVTFNSYIKVNVASGFAAAGNYFEIVICSGALSSLQLNQLEGYLAWNNSGMLALLPANHPYKNAAPTN